MKRPAAQIFSLTDGFPRSFFGLALDFFYGVAAWGIMLRYLCPFRAVPCADKSVPHVLGGGRRPVQRLDIFYDFSRLDCAQQYHPRSMKKALPDAATPSQYLVF